MLKKLGENEIVSSIKTTIKDRMVSVMYGTFVISWCIWNWEVIYITFFIDQNLILETAKQLKIDYIIGQYTWTSWQTIAWSLLRLFIAPSLMTYIIIWQLSKLDFICFKRYHSDACEKKNELFTMENKLLKREKAILEKKEENVEIEKKIKKEMTNEDKWDIEYKRIEASRHFYGAMMELKECLYNYRGRISAPGFRMASDIAAYLHTNGIITFTDNSRNIIEATEKGKHILKRFMQVQGS